MLKQRFQKLEEEIAAVQPELNRLREKYLKALEQNAPNKAELEAVYNQLVEKEKALISSRDKLVDKLPGAQPVCMLNCMCPAECCT